uniref:threonine--tRNA ligase n=1 Tax=Gemmiger formicilis TaxID=745368 RepID=UPI003FF13F89
MKIIYKDGTVAECPQEEELHVLRHTAAHIMAQAIKRLYPQADFAFGPATENGFYYDVDLGDTKLTDEDLAAIEKEMKKICKENLPIKPFILPRDEAVKLMEERQEHYKIEHMADLADETEFSFYQQGEYVDMCIGPHLCYTKALKAFKITQQSGAYWKNDKENKMLTRINGVAFHSQEELDAWEKQQQEARERDHRKIGKEMRLFMTDDLVGRGLPMFLPNGYTVWQQLEDYIKGKERERGYLHVMTPCIGTVNLYKTSGHWDHYRENMFPAMEMEGESYVLRPMNCPHHMMIYANQPHSYRQLPIRIGEIAHDFRYESSGTLKGIERGRHFCQNDAHLFCTPEQIKSEVANVCALIFDVYKDFNITDYRCVLSLRDPADKKKYHDDDAMWNHAENALREVLTELDIHFTEEIGEAAFYGPKLDVNVKPAV